jgi:hypothetical protein
MGVDRKGDPMAKSTKAARKTIAETKSELVLRAYKIFQDVYREMDWPLDDLDTSLTIIRGGVSVKSKLFFLHPRRFSVWSSLQKRVDSGIIGCVPGESISIVLYSERPSNVGIDL